MKSSHSRFPSPPVRQVGLTAITSAIQIVSDCKRDQRQKREARDAAEANLTKLMRKLVFELNAAMEPEDVRWLDFAANRAGSSAPGEMVDATVPALANVA